MKNEQFNVLIGLISVLFFLGVAFIALVTSEILFAMGHQLANVVLKLLFFVLMSLSWGAITRGYNRTFWQWFGGYDHPPLEDYYDAVNSNPTTLQEMRGGD